MHLFSVQMMKDQSYLLQIVPSLPISEMLKETCYSTISYELS